MRKERVGAGAMGWLAGSWDGDLQVAVGFANQGIDEPHVHCRITEIDLVACGAELEAGDVLIVEPGEAHTFLGTLEDYLHFVIQTPGLARDAAKDEKELYPARG